MTLTQARLKEVLSYDPSTGLFRWIANTAVNSRIDVGSIAGTTDKNGYRVIQLDNRFYRAHRLAWLYIYGEFPSNDLDHINGARSDNRITNLRVANDAENAQNVTIEARGKSGLRGASFHRSTGKYQSYIRAYGKNYHLGLFDTAEEAHQAYLEAKRELHTFQPTPRTGA